MKRLFLFFFVGFMLTSCNAPKRVIYREASGRNIEPAQGAVITPLVADLEIISQQSVRNTITFDVVVKTDMLGEIENFKRMALLQTAHKYNADTMVAALMNVDTNQNGNLEITVTGYPARYINFRPMTEKDQWITKFDGESRNIKKKEQKVSGGLGGKLLGGRKK